MNKQITSGRLKTGKMYKRQVNAFPQIFKFYLNVNRLYI